MSAKISIETQDKALAATLGMVIAKAIQDAGFTNVKAKTVMVEPDGDQSVRSRLLNATLVDSKVTQTPVGARTPPQLGDLRFIVPPNLSTTLEIINRANPGIQKRPVVLSFFNDRTLKYHMAEERFLKGD